MRIFISLFILFIQSNMFSQKEIIYADSKNVIPITGTSILILEDSSNKFAAHEVLNSAKFKPNNLSVPNLGISKSAFWLKLIVKNQSEDNLLLLNLAYPNLDEAELHIFKADTYLVEKLGKYLPFSQRNYNYPGYIFNLNLSKHATATVLIKIKSGGQILAPVFIGNKNAVFETIRNENLFVGIYTGIILIMFLYNLFIYFTVKDKLYLYYVGYIIIVGLMQICLLGYTFQYLWPNSTWLARHSVYLLSPISCIMIIEFIKIFLRTKEFTPSLHKGFHLLTSVYIIYILLDLFNLADNLYAIIQLCAMILSFYILFVSFKIMRMNYRPAKFLFYAWIIFLIGVFVYALKDVGVLPYNNYTIYMMPIGSAIETALLSFALADRINLLKKEKEVSQSYNFELLEENKRIVDQQNIILESKVTERTAQLESSNKSLKEAQSQLVNAEKMVSLGQLTAGIAHEINNPINSVYGNVKPLKRDIAQLINLLSKYSEIKNSEGLSEKLKEIENYKTENEISYIIEEMDVLLKGIDDGAKRTAEIVKSLREFSHNDEPGAKKTNIIEGLNSTLLLLKNSLNKPEIEVVNKHANEILYVDCIGGQINQVFMNILTNAIQAMETFNDNVPKKLIVETYSKGNTAIIKIIDNGPGIPQKIINKIFEPFFTTKSVGSGTGLGLSISFNIVKNHNGTLEVNSKEGSGTEFIIILPLSEI